MQALRKIAMRLPEAEEGIACKGTAIECSTFKAGNKAFLFVSKKDARLKLRESLAEAAIFATQEPGRYSVGAGGWVKVALGQGDSLPLEVLERWIGESYRVLAPKQLVAQMSSTGAMTSDDKRAAKKKPPRRIAKKRPSPRPDRRSRK